MSSSDDDSLDLSDDGADVVNMILGSPGGSTTRQTRSKTKPDNDVWKEPSRMSLEFSFKVEKPKIPRGLLRDLKTNTKIKLLTELMKQDQQEELAKAKEMKEWETKVRSQLSKEALRNDNYVQFLLSRSEEELDNMKYLYLFKQLPVTPGSDIVSHDTITDLQMLEMQLSNFTKIHYADIAAIICGGNSFKSLKVVEELSFKKWNANYAETDCSSDDLYEFNDLKILLKSIGVDMDLIENSKHKDLLKLKKFPDFQSHVSIENQLTKLSCGFNLFIADEFKYITKLTTSDGSQKILQTELVESHHLELLRIALLASCDERVYEVTSSESRALVAKIIDNVVVSYMEIYSCLRSSLQNFKRLYEKVLSMMHSLSSSLKILERLLLNLHRNKTSQVTNHLFNWVSFAIIVSDENGINSLNAEEKTSLTLLPSSLDPRKLSYEPLITNLVRFLQIISVRPLEAGFVNYRDNVPFFVNLKVKFKLIEILLFKILPTLTEYKELIHNLYQTHAQQLEGGDFLVLESTIVPHLLSFYLTRIKERRFSNFELISNPILAQIMTILGNLVSKLEKQLQLKVLDLEIEPRSPVL